jgi:itaconate CoA-transferase
VTSAPLDGILVVGVEQAVAAPFATRQLADLGARVIKIERPGTGDFARHYDSKVGGMSSVFVWLNRGKESVELDIKTPAGRGVLDALLERADVFIQNIAPDAARALGLDTASLEKRFPRLIPAAISGYGTSGPLASSRAYDLLVQGETGLMSLNGDEEHYARVGISIADISAGMYAYASILAALHHRSRTGAALPVNVSLFDSLAEWLSYPLYYTMHGGGTPADGDEPRHHRTVRRLLHRGRRTGAPRRAERQRVAAVLPAGARRSGAGRRPPILESRGPDRATPRPRPADQRRAGRL